MFGGLSVDLFSHEAVNWELYALSTRLMVGCSYCSAVWADVDTGLIHEETFWPYAQSEIRQAGSTHS